MSVIIRLQNLPWAANARDIRNFFAGLSIPEGGVHIIGGEMGDAFIAFSTDEDARKAMLMDREKLMETQVRLLLSSRAEMQKVIETARQQSLASTAVSAPVVATPTVTPAVVVPPVAAVAPTKLEMPIAPTPPIISASGLQSFLTQTNLGKAPSFLAYQQQAGIVLADAAGLGYGQKATVAPKPTRKEHLSPERRRSSSRDRRRSSSRDRRRSRSRSRDRSDRDHNSSRRSRHDRHSRDRSRERSWSRERERDWRGSRSSRRDDDSRERELETKPKKPIISPWSIPPVNSGMQQQQQSAINPIAANDPFKLSATAGVQSSTPFNTVPNLNLGGLLHAKQDEPVPTPTIIPGFQSYSTTPSSTNNYSINLLGGLAGNDALAQKPMSLQNPYLPALQSLNSSSSSSDSIPGLGLGLSNQPPPKHSTSMLASSNLNILSKLTPEKKPDTLSPATLLVQQQAAAMLKQQQQQAQQATLMTTKPPIVAQPQQVLPQEPIAFASVNPYAQMYPQLFEQAAARTTSQPAPQTQQQQHQLPPRASNQNSNQSGSNSSSSQSANMDTCYIKISNMCNSTTYSDLRKFFAGLYIPHNGIKIINDNQGQRVGIAFVEFSRVSSAHKALARSNTQFKNKSIRIEAVSHHEFENAEDSYRPGRQNDNDSSNAMAKSNSRQSPTNMGGEFGGGSGSGGGDMREPYTVLFLEELPQLATEQDIMKMFSSFTIVDILMCASPNNRREQVAHVQFSREDEARAALNDTGRHTIGYRKIRVRPGRLSEMKNAKEKLRLANEQLMKEEQASSSIVIDDDSMEMRDVDNDDDGGGSGGSSDNNEGSNSRFSQENSNNAFDMSKMNGGNFNADPRRRGQTQQQQQQQQQQSNMQRNHNNNNNNSNNSNNFNNNNMNDQASFMFNSNNQGGPTPTGFQLDEEKYVLAKNCEYRTRINDMGEWLAASDLRMNHIEMLYNERNLPAGEFIIEFVNSRDADRAVREFHNRRFRGRSIRFMHITPQEIANRLRKPFMNYVPGGNGKVLSNDCVNENDGREQLVQAALELINRSIGMSNGTINENLFNPNCFGSNDNNNMDQQQFNNGPIMSNDSMSDNMKQHRNPFADPPTAGINDVIGIAHNDMPMNQELIDNVGGGGGGNGNGNGNGNNGDGDGGIPDKFNRPGCVIAMRNVPFKANLKDILRFFNDYKLNPEDIIRRFNDDGTPTGDARVAFESVEQARSAYESRRRKQIFHRNIFLSIL